MKTKIITILSVASAMLFATSCNSDDELTPQASGTAVEFSTTITRASGDAWDNGDQIGVFMKTEGQTLGSATPLANNVLYTNSATGFTTATPIYYPMDGTTVDFVAYYPYRATPGTTPYIYKVSVADQTTPADIDLLYSASATGKNKSSGTVTLDFTHKLSRVVLNIKADGTSLTNAQLSGMTVAITGMPTTADFSLVDGTTFSAHGTATDISPLAIATLPGYASNLSAIIIPQAATAGRTMTFTVGSEVYTYAIPATDAFETGKNYPYEITVSKTGITVTAATITPWDDATTPITGTGGDVQYKIGDYYPDPSATFTAGVLTSGVSPIGVVYQISNGGKNGRVVSLNEGTDLEWGPYPSTTTATNFTDGRANMSAIASYISTTPSAWTAFPAFNWVIGKNGSTGWDADTDRWYLPAKNELRALYAGFSGLNYGASGTGWIADWGDYVNMPDYSNYAGARTAFNGKLTAAGGTAISADWYWSSSQDNDDDAWIVLFDNGDTNHNFKYDPYRVRAVQAF